MVKFKGRSSQIITIPGKPIPVGFKQEALADSGYILNWEACRPNLNEGGSSPIEVTTPEEIKLVKKTFLTNTQAIVARLAITLNPYTEKGLRFHFYLDNLFTCWRLCSYLWTQGIAVTGTARKGACGIPPRLLALKAASAGLKWGALQVSIVHEVACFIWQDQSAVLGRYAPLTEYSLTNIFSLGITTGHLVNAETIRSRKQPKKSSSQANITREPFNGNFRANLPIPDFIDRYNANMGQVDVANQLRAPYTAYFRRNCKEFFPGMF